MQTLYRILSIGIVSTSFLCAVYLYTAGLLNSPLFNPDEVDAQQYLIEFIHNNSPDIERERLLAEAYWMRYADVRSDRHWGENGPMGIWGPRDHFLLHGKREGRIFQPVIYPEDKESESELAEIYWNRYPDIRRSRAWGEHSALGIFGPRDHYTYIGRFEKRVWGTSPDLSHKERAANPGTSPVQ